MGRLGHRWAESAARRELHNLAGLLAVPGALPAGLLAILDQHAAAVRDILTLSGNPTGVIDLAAYAGGVRDVATESGWQPSAHSPGEWADNWVNVRLAAVCMLAGVTGSAVPYGDADPLPSL